MRPSEVIQKILADHGAVLTNTHVVYASGKHGHTYINKDAVFPHTVDLDRLAQYMAGMAITRSKDCAESRIDAVVGPVVGGAILSNRVAAKITEVTGHPVLALYADKERRPGEQEDHFVFKRGYAELVRGKSVWVVEDVLTTGGTLLKVVEAVRAAGGYVMGVVAICNRGDVKRKEVGDVPSLDSLLNLTLDMWDEADCPLCKSEVPINTTVGKGKEFLARLAAAQIG